MTGLPFALGAASLVFCMGGSTTADSNPDLSNTIPILDEYFEADVNRYDGRSGLWSTLPRRRQIVSNASATAFWDSGLLPTEAEARIVPTLAPSENGLALRTVHVPETARKALDDYLTRTKQAEYAGKIRFLTGQINTHETWAQRYGYFEVTARIPVGKGRWPAAWLTDAGPGWPPELDIFEAYGKGISTPTDHDHRFNMALHFEAEDRSDSAESPRFFLNGQEQPANWLEDYKGGHFAFQRFVDAQAEFGADIYGQFNTYAAMWTPDTITYYFGPNPEQLSPIYTVPTPPGAKHPMYLIVNDQFTTQGLWWEPDPDMIEQVVTTQNALQIRRIRIHALRPNNTVNPDQPDPGDSVLIDTTGNDVLEPGTGFDLISLSGGADTLYLERGIHGKIVSGFGQDDVAILVGYPFENTSDAMARLTQVGNDVWLPSGADPANPQTLIFRDKRLGDFRAAQLQTRWPVARKDWAADAARDGTHLKPSGAGQVVRADAAGRKLNDTGLAVTLIGGKGHDHYYIANGDTKIVERAYGGIDTLTTYVSFTLPDHVEHAIADAAGVTLSGNSRSNRLHATARNVTLAAGEGNDLYVIEAGAGAIIRIDEGDGHDRLVGLKPTDIIVFSRHLDARRADWRVTQNTRGLKITLSPSQSLVIEGEPRTLLAQLSLSVDADGTK